MATNAAQKYDHNVGYTNKRKVSNIRVINTSYTEANKSRYTDRPAANDSSYQAINEIADAEASKRLLQPQGLSKSNPRREATSDSAYSENKQINKSVNQRRKLRQDTKLTNHKKSVAIARKLAIKARVSAVNITIFSWSITAWVGVQLPLALLSLAALGAAGIAQSIISSVPFLGSVLQTLNSVVAKGGSLLGLDIDLAAGAQGAVMALNMIVFAMGIIFLLIMVFQYTFSRLKPLSGQAAGLKIGVFVIAIAGYFIPIANLFPWAVIYAAVVWKYPK
jgi:hypothetical protein